MLHNIVTVRHCEELVANAFGDEARLPDIDSRAVGQAISFFDKAVFDIQFFIAGIDMNLFHTRLDL